MRVRVARIVLRGSARAPDPAELRERVADELRASLRPFARAPVRDPVAVVAEAVARAAGGSGE